MSEPDHPNVMIFPPVIPLVTVAMALALQWVIPPGLLERIHPVWRIVIGSSLVLTGVLLTIAGARALVVEQTNVSPSRPTRALATDGIYRWTRNPMYAGGGPLMIGIAVLFALDWLVLLVVPSFLILHFGVVRREEQYLEHKFGDEYRRYCACVPRYLWPWSGSYQKS